MSSSEILPRHLVQLIGARTIARGNARQQLRPIEAAAVAYVCLRASPTSRQQLATALWPTASYKRARQSLNQLLYELKKKHEVATIETAGAIRFPELVTDVDAVRDLLDAGEYVAALRTLTGVFLHDCPIVTGDLALWRDEVEHTLSGFVKTAVVGALQTCIDRDIQETLDVCEASLAHQPHLIHEHRVVIEAAARSGDVARARRLYAQWAASQRDETAIPDFDNIISSATFRPVVSDGPNPERAKFVGRKNEIQQLWEDWQYVVGGNGCTRVVWGEPGIGKTRLAIQILRRIAISGGSVWVVKCSAATKRVPFQAARMLIEENVSDAAQTFPELALLWRDNAPTEWVDGDRVKHALVTSLTNLVLNYAASRPLAILFDDAQWADDFSSMLISYWSYRLRHTSVYLLNTARNADVDSPPAWLTNELATARHLQLGAMNAEDAEALIESYLQRAALQIQPDRRARVLRQSGGTPFLLLEATAAATGNTHTGTPCRIPLASIEGLLSGRFQQLPGNAEWLMGILAAIAQPVAVASLGQLSGLSDSETATALATLQKRRIAHCVGGTIQFPHDIMRDLAYGSITSGMRALLHHRLAVLLADQLSPDAIVAHHYSAAGDAHNCARHSLLAAESARASHLYADAEYYYRLAIKHASAEQVVTAAQGLSHVLLQLGRMDDVEEILGLLPNRESEDSIDVILSVAMLEQELRSSSSSTLVVRARTLTRLISQGGMSPATVGGTLLGIAIDTCANELGSEVIAALEAASNRVADEDFRIQSQALAAIWETLSSSVAAGASRLQSIPDDRSLSGSTRALLGSARALVAFHGGHVNDALSLYQEALQLAEAAEDLRRQWIIRTNLAVVCMEAGRFAEARRGFEMGVTSPITPFRTRIYQNLAVLHYEEGEYALAQQAAHAVLIHNRVYQAPNLEAAAHAIIGLSALKLAHISTAKEHFALLGQLAWEPSMALDDNSYTIAFIARIHAHAGNPAVGIDLLQRAINSKRDIDTICVLRLRCELARLLTSQNIDLAYSTAKQIRDVCRRSGATLLAREADSILERCR